MSTDSFPAQAGPVAGDVIQPVRLRPWDRLESIRVARWGAVACVAVLVLVSLYLRTRGIRFYYWIDEGLSVGIASHPFTHIPSLLQQDGSPPLYYLILHVWMALRGSGEVATHELSLIFGLLIVPVAYWAGASLFDRRTGLICAVLAAGAPYLTAYAQETRMYALLALLGTVAGASFVHAFVLRHRRHLAVFVISLTAALYTHNWALFLGLASAIAFLVCVWSAAQGQRRELWRDGAIAFGAVAVLYAAWVPTLLYQAGHTGAPWDLAPSIWSFTQGLYSLVGGRGAAVALLLAGGTGLVAIRHLTPLRGFAALRSQQTLLAAVTLFILGVGTLVIAWLYSKTTPAWANRYLGIAVGPLILLFGLGLARARRLGIVALVLLAGFWLLDPVATSRTTKSNVGLVAPKLRAKLGTGALVLSAQPEQVPTLAYYLPGVSRFATPLGPVPDPRVVNWRDALERMRHAAVYGVLTRMVDSMRPGQRIMLVVPVNLATTPLWLKLINVDAVKWTRVLERDRSLQMITSDAKRAPGSGTGVRATVFVVLAHPRR